MKAICDNFVHALELTNSFLQGLADNDQLDVIKREAARRNLDRNQRVIAENIYLGSPDNRTGASMTGNLFPDQPVHNPVKPPKNRTAEARLEYLCYIFDVALTAYELHDKWSPQTIAELRRQIAEAREP